MKLLTSIEGGTAEKTHHHHRRTKNKHNLQTQKTRQQTSPPSSVHKNIRITTMSQTRKSSKEPSTTIDTNKKVRFALDETNNKSDAEVSVSPPLASELPDYRSIQDDLWYRSEEIAAFKRDARNIVAFRKKIAKKDEDDVYGLGRYSLERAKHKRRIIHCILVVASRIGLKNESGAEEFLRAVSERLSERARKEAQTQGFFDFCEVYDPLESLLGDDGKGEENSYNDYFFNKKHKRTLRTISSPRSEDRRIRQRGL